MRSTFAGIEIAKTGLMVSQKGLDVTGHNIANVDTAGYTRQRLVTTAYDPYAAITQFKPVTKGLVGSGANVMILDQIRSSFLDRQYRTEQTALSNWQTRTQGLTYVESVLEGGYGSDLKTTLNSLFDGFNAILTNSSDLSQRKYVQSEAITLVESLNHVYNSLIDLQKDQNTAVVTVVGQINTIAENIATLNKKIFSYELDGQPANDLRDKRNLLLDQLSALVDIKYETDTNGYFSVTIGGETLIDHGTTYQLTTTKVSNTVSEGAQVDQVIWADSGDALDYSGGGELKGHIDLRDNDSATTPGIPYFINQLNDWTRAIVQEINNIHAQGYTHPSSGEDSHNGVLFFDGPALLDIEGLDPSDAVDAAEIERRTADYEEALKAITAGNVKLSAAILESAYNIACSSIKIDLSDPSASTGDESELQAGNNNISQLLFNLQDKINITISTRDAGGTSQSTSIGSLAGFIDSIVLDIATTLSRSKTMTSTQESTVLSADNQRMSISGVSLDEEMTNLIKYQHAYTGASRVITTMDEALDVLINRMGLVGLR